MATSGDKAALDALPLHAIMPLRVLGPLRVAVPLACCVPAFGAAQTAPAPPEDWTCARCVIAEGWQLDVSAGPGATGDEAFRFGDFTGVDDDGAYLFGDLFGRYRDSEGRYSSLEGWSRGSGAFALFAEGGRQGLYRASASVESIPRHYFDTTRTPFRGTNDAQLVLPSDWVRASTTTQMTALQSSAAPAAIGFDRSAYRIGLDVEPRTDWRLSIDYKHQRRDGNIRSSGAILFSALEFVSPVDYSTDDVEAALEYSGATWQIGASYFSSVFRNANESIAWENPYNALLGVQQGRQALAPDNDAQRVAITGYASLPGRTTIAGSFSTGRLRQNAALLPFTTNASIPSGPLPSGHADARADTTNFDLRITSSPATKLTLVGDLEFRDFDNQTPMLTYDFIVTDVLAATRPATSRAYDFEKRKLELRAEYRQSSATKLEIGTELGRSKRNFQSRRQTDTRRLWLSARTRAGSDNQLSVEFFDERRDGSSFEAILQASTPENPLMRKYHLADRDRRGARFDSTFIGGERSDFGFEVEVSQDRYDESVLGITDTDYLRIGADYSLLYSQRTTIYANVYTERYESTQSNSQSFDLPDWSSTIEDDFDTVTIGSRLTELFGKVDLELEAGWSRSIGRLGNDTGGVSSELPDVRSDTRYARIGVGYPYSEKLDINVDYYYQSLDTNDWALDGVYAATAPALLSLGAEAWQYRVNVVWLSFAWSITP